jgi:hypothetical protein
MMTSTEEREREARLTFWKIMACDNHTWPITNCKACYNKMFDAIEVLRVRGILVADTTDNERQ